MGTAGIEWKQKRFGVSEIAVLGAAVANLGVVGQLAWAKYAPRPDAGDTTLLRQVMADFEQNSDYLFALVLGPTVLSACLLFYLWRRPGVRDVGWSLVPLLLTLGLVAINVALIRGPGLVALTIPLVAVPAIMGFLGRSR